MSEVNTAGLAETNPAAEGFNSAASDPEAIEIADEVMEAMGGRAAWDNTRYLRWTFFGRRTLLWDKQTGDVRIDVPADSAIYLINVNEDNGQVMMRGEEITNPDSLAKYVEQGKKMWVNDSYWLVMPYKLKDSGVTLAYAGEDTMQTGDMADVLELRFENVGFTPQNKYRVYVDKNDRLIKQWAYYSEASLDSPNFITPWADYQEYDGIKLSGNRGDRGLSDIGVFDSIPRQDAFTLNPFSFN
ncbi:hypothetical protein [Catalinimonas niigatensis]|uniref:hypothetical protein n=1 Tax=Catalinimonas niigatensis TaxID=1397264 RepID=UPI0026668143|nr:hypothetical protein [Catalinimonas niigatensis]WPP52811.1 hypothetical protein PZB72_10520 [Catalinimonas niigatensis]